MRKYLLYAAILAACVSMSSCRRAAEKARKKIRIEAVEAIERHGMSGFDALLRIKNGTGYKLSLETAGLELFYGDARIGEVTLREGIKVPKRTTVSVETRWRLRISDPLAFYLLVKKLQQGDVSQIGVSFALKGRGGPAKVDLSQTMLPLPQFLHLFGWTTDDLINYLK